MPDIQLIGYTHRRSLRVKRDIRRLLRGAAYTSKLSIVWLASEAEDLDSGKSQPFLRIVGRRIALRKIIADMEHRLRPIFDIETAYLSRWAPRKERKS